MSRVERQYRPDQMQQRTYGPFNAADTGTNTRIPLDVLVKGGRIDQMAIRAEAVSTANATMRLGWADDGETLSAASTANQWLTDAIDLRAQATGDLVVNTLLDSEADVEGSERIDLNNNNSGKHLDAKSVLFVEFSASATALANLMIALDIAEGPQL